MQTCFSQDPWMTCTLCRSGRQGVEVLQRAQRRQVEWPKQSVQDSAQRGSRQVGCNYNQTVKYW